MSYRALMFDIDGTLIDADCRMCDSTLKILRQKKKEGIHLSINSGRPIALSVPYIQELCGDLFDLIIGSNGSEYYDCKTDSSYLKTAFDKEELDTIFKTFDHPSLILGVYDDHYLLTDKDVKEKELDHWLKQRGVLCLKSQRGDKAYPKVLGLHAKKDHEVVKEFVSGLMKPAFLETAFSSERVLEIYPKGSDKGLGVLEVAGLLKCDPKEIICFGDGENDLAMLEAGHGVVMGNGDETIKKAIGKVTDACDEDGIYNYLMMLENGD